MNCYDCNQVRTEKVALGVCHICGAGLCAEHTRETKKTITVTHPSFARVAVDPPHRSLSCNKCADTIDAAYRIKHEPLKTHD